MRYCWITCSPKQENPRVGTYYACNEIKWLVGDGLELWNKVSHQEIMGSYEYIQPLVIKDINSIESKENLKNAIRIVKENPRFGLSVQLHKYIDIR